MIENSQIELNYGILLTPVDDGLSVKNDGEEALIIIL